MEVIKLLEYLQEILETSSKIPMSNKVVVNKKEFLQIIEQIINYLPEEFKKAEWICEEKDKILKDANEQAEMIKKESLDIIREKINNHDYVKQAYLKAEEIVLNSEKKASVVKNGSKEYALDKIMTTKKEIENRHEEFMGNVKKEMERYIMNMEQYKNQTISYMEKDLDELKNLK